MDASAWPSLPLADWVETRDTVHLWTQMIGKVKLELCPFVNEWWEVGLSLTARGLTTGLIPAGRRSFQIDLDLHGHRLVITTSAGEERSLALEPRTIAEFHAAFTALLAELAIPARFNPVPSEVAEPIRFDEDGRQRSYDRDAVERWWRAMVSVERVMQRFRTGFSAKSSPVLFYWGGFDLNHTRFTGRRTPQPVDADPIRRFGEDEENFAIGFWPGAREAPEPVLYAYPSPAPEGLDRVVVEPVRAGFLEPAGEFVLPYEAARATEDPDGEVLAFFRSAFAGTAALAGWDLARLTGPVPERWAQAAIHPDGQENR